MAAAGSSQIRRRGAAYLVLATCAVLVGMGLMGSPSFPERFDAKQIILTRVGERGLGVTEVVDIDFGSNKRRGYERIVRLDFGEPTDISAESDTISNRVTTTEVRSGFRMRVGDPDETHVGQHRVTLNYTLPDAISGDTLDYSLIDPGTDNETGRFEVVLHGFRLDNSLCSVGWSGSEGGCELTDTSTGQTVVLEPLRALYGLNISGSVQPAVTNEMPAVEPPGERRSPVDRLWRVLVVVAVGLAAIETVLAIMQRRGANIVGVGGAAAAAHWEPGQPTERATDEGLVDMATTEFVPPAGIMPWEGRVLLDESVGNDAPQHWVSSMVGAGALTLEKDGGAVVIAAGPGVDEIGEPADRELLDRLLPGGVERRISGSYDKEIAKIWSDIRSSQRERIRARKWWRGRVARGSAGDGAGAGVAVIFIFGLIAVVAGAESSDGAGVLNSMGSTVIASTAMVALTALVATFRERASRTAAGSAAFLQTESFRRFLHASEARHVEDAYDRGVLREYSAWAVALGEADAWKRAAERIQKASITAAVATTMVMYDTRSTFTSTITAPSSSSDSSGGFGGGGGSVGGGGGGGSSGSW
ncbi:MAG: DUF2207 family protein [Ilumatobacteraceae bacterium]